MGRLAQTDGLTDVQQEILATVRDFVDKEILPHATAWEHADTYPQDVVDGMRELGLFGLMIDEEYGGANGTLACRLRGYEADAAILCEPTQLEICPANQGAVIYRTTFRGKESFLFNEENPLNPTYAGARFLEIVRRYEVHHKEKPSSSKFFKDDPGPPTFVMGVRAGSIKPPFSERAPGECIIDVGIQCYPETSEEELYEDFTNFYFRHARKDAILAQFRPTFDRLIRFLPGSQIPQDHAIIDVVSRSARLVQGHELPIRGAPYASDSFMFNLHSNTPVLIWGPKGGNAHAPDEYIEVEPFMQLVNMYALTIAEWCGGTEYA
jgi:acetylornithine deacetylase